MSELIGIDLGTTNSVLAYLKGGPELINIKGRPSLPSVVAYDADSWLVGHAAKNLASRSDDVIVSPKRKMGTDHKYTIDGKTYTPVDISAMILKELKQQAEETLGGAVDTAVITIPAYFNHQQADDTRKAAEKAGLKVGQLLQEPIAAAATYGSGGEDVILVFDLGGGTLDCTVIDMFDRQIMGLSGDNWLGGDDFDNRIVDRMVKVLKQESGIDVSAKGKFKLKEKAEEAKINLSETNSTQVEFIGKLDGQLCQVEFRLTRDEYNEMIHDLVTRAIEKADEAIKQAKLTADEIDVVLTVGGSTLTPYVQECLEKHFGKPPSKRVDPMLAVGLGAAICTRDVVLEGHRVVLRSRAEVWPESTYDVRGRTSADSKVEITGGNQPADTTADADGKFETQVALKENDINDLTVIATSPAGEVAKARHRVRHDTKGEVKAEEPAIEGVIRPVLPHNIMLGLSNDRVATVLPAGRTLPTSYEDGDRFSCSANAIAFTLMGPVYEGSMPEHEIPFGPFNSHMGQLNIQCPPTSSDTPLVVSFEMDESRNLTFKCWFKDDPSVFNEVTLKPKQLSKEEMHLLDRVDQVINGGGDRIRPDERTKISHRKQALIDMCEQHAALPEGSREAEDIRERIVSTGNELKSEIEAVERKYNL